MRKFSDLPPLHPPPPYWQEERDRFAQLAAALDAEPIVSEILSAIEAAFTAGSRLPTVAGLRGNIPEQPGHLRILTEALPQDERTAEGVAKRLNNAALARFLASVPTDFKRLSAVARLEHHVDWTYLPECFARELKIPQVWVDRLLGDVFKLESKESEDEQELLEEEVTKWATERQKPVPQWRAGNLMSMGIQELLLAAALLRAVDEKAWLRFLDTQPFPAVVETLLWQARLDAEPAGVLRLIAQSPPAFDAEGVRQGSVAIYFIIEKALAFIEGDLDRRIKRDTTRQENEAELVEQEGLLQELVDALGARDDATVLLLELGASYLLRAQAAVPEFGRMRNRFEIYERLATTICKKLGTPETVVTAARARAQKVARDSSWGLWLLAAESTCAREALSRETEITGLRQDLWEWLKELAVAGDSSLADRYSNFPEWVLQLVGFNLAKLTAPLAELESAWTALTAQRVKRVENRYAEDTWRISKLICRGGFLAARVAGPTDLALAESLWGRCMKMAISSWLSSPNDDSFSEVTYGLCHLAAGPILVRREPANTLAYLRGEPDLLARAAVALRANGFAPEEIIRVARAEGIDVLCHLELATNRAQIEGFEDELERFRKAASDARSSPSTP